jgi:hypothetical protein
MFLKFLKGAYEIPITLLGCSNTMDKITKIGAMSFNKDLDVNTKKYLSEEEIEMAPVK